MSITFGFEPYSIDVVLSRGSRFTAAITTEDPWPHDVEIELRFAESTDPDQVLHTWPADISSDQAAWNVPATEVDALIADHARRATLIFRTEGQPVVWGKGPARVIA